jgi:hypothetical protein
LSCFLVIKIDFITLFDFLTNCRHFL